MTPYTKASRALASRLAAGEHALTNEYLRESYGITRVTTKARSDVAAGLRDAGLQIVSDPDSEPLVVRKLAAARTPQPRGHGARLKVWWRRPWVVAVGSLVLLFLIVGALSGGDPAGSSDSAQAAQELTVTPEPTATASPTVVPKTMGDARAAVADDDYPAALVIAAALGHDDERSIGRRISRRLASRAARALRTNDRARASRLLREARGYPRTAEVGRAAKVLKSAQARAKARAVAQRKAQAVARAQRRARVEARRVARVQARQRAEAARVARVAARRRAEAVANAPAAPPVSEPSMSGPSTTNWCGKRDGDGDGIYCEGM